MGLAAALLAVAVGKRLAGADGRLMALRRELESLEADNQMLRRQLMGAGLPEAQIDAELCARMGARCGGSGIAPDGGVRRCRTLRFVPGGARGGCGAGSRAGGAAGRGGVPPGAVQSHAHLGDRSGA